MIVVMVKIPVASDEQVEGMVGRFRNRAGMVDSQPGFRSFELLRGEGELISMTHWETRADLDRWMSGEAHAQVHSHSGGGRAPQPAGSVAIYEVVIPGESGG